MKNSGVLSLFWVVVCAAAILLGTYLRYYYGLSTELWDDEAISFFIAKDVSWYEIATSSGGNWDQVHPPLHLLFLKIWLSMGHADLFLRLTSLVMFFPSLYLVFLIGKKTLTPVQTLFALSLFSLHPLLVNLSFQVRPYALAILLSLAAVYALISHLRQPTQTSAIWLGLWLGLAFLTSYGALWLLLAVAFLIVQQAAQKGWGKVFDNFGQTAVVFAVVAGWQIFTLFSALADRFVQGMVIAGSVPLFNWQWFTQELSLLIGVKSELFAISVLLALPLLFLLKKAKKDLLFLSLFVGGILGSVVSSVFFSPIFLARQLFVSLIGLIFLLAKLGDNLRSKLFLLVILCVYAYLSLQTYGFLFQSRIDVGAQQVRDGDLVLTFEGNHDYLNYYLFVNNKQAEVAVLSMDQHISYRLLREAIDDGYSRFVFFTNYCPGKDYEFCQQIVNSLQTQFCQHLSCTIAI